VRIDLFAGSGDRSEYDCEDCKFSGNLIFPEIFRTFWALMGMGMGIVLMEIAYFMGEK